MDFLKNKLAKINFNEPKEEDDLKCYNCGSRIMVIARQTRKSDEGMTIFFKCEKCPFTKKKN
jgi:DNA-directed RNA polymerase subunit M/transcription elongation factor TFIIS